MTYNFSWTDFSEKADTQDFNSIYSINEQTELNIFGDTVVCHTFIEGDNYPALKLIKNQYKEKISIIYIDPPYNTGKKTFTYNDNFSEKQDKHSSWLSFMFRRLTLAKELLKDDGCIFIAIGQDELYNLKLLCDKIFGEENFINDFMWLHGKGKKDNWSRTMQQSNLCYAKNKKKLKPFLDFEYTSWAKTNSDNDSRGPWFSGSISFDEKRSNPKHPNYYKIVSPSGIEWQRQWLIPQEEMQKLISQNKIYWGKAPKYNNVPRQKIFNGEKTEIIPKNIIDCAQTTREAQNHVDTLLNEQGSFDNPKPVDLIKHLIKITNMQNDSIIMDFFAGSGTTLEAVHQLNREDNGCRNCVVIQKPEPIENKASKFKTIAELCYTRIAQILCNTTDSLKYFKVQEKD